LLSGYSLPDPEMIETGADRECDGDEHGQEEEFTEADAPGWPGLSRRPDEQARAENEEPIGDDQFDGAEPEGVETGQVVSRAGVGDVSVDNRDGADGGVVGGHAAVVVDPQETPYLRCDAATCGWVESQPDCVAVPIAARPQRYEQRAGDEAAVRHE